MMRVLIADDHAIVRQGLRQILAETSDMVVGGEAQSGQEILKLIRNEEWDVVVLDITLSNESGLEILKEIKRERPKLPVLVLSIHSEDQYALRVLKSGGAGYLTKESAADELVRAIRKVASGGKYISTYLAEKLASLLEYDMEKPLHESLSDREYQVLCLIVSGKTVKDIAKEMSLSVKTISTYRSRILEKMKMRTNTELIRYGIHHGLVE